MYKGIYVLETLGEYRIYVGNIATIYVGIDPVTSDYIIDPVSVKGAFGGSAVFTDKECVTKAALEIGKITGEVEDGIYFVKDLVEVVFADFVADIK